MCSFKAFKPKKLVYFAILVSWVLANQAGAAIDPIGATNQKKIYWTYNGQDVNFKISEFFYGRESSTNASAFLNIFLCEGYKDWQRQCGVPSMSAQDTTLEMMDIDFGDGVGVRKNLTKDSVVNVRYGTLGIREIYITGQAITREWNDIYGCYGCYDRVNFNKYIKIDVRQLSTPQPSMLGNSWNVAADIPYAGAYGSGKVYVYYANPDKRLRRPVVVVDGFDPEGKRDEDELYNEYLKQQNLIERGRALGYDFVVLNPNDGADYIQRSAFLLVKLIKQINAAKEGSEQLVVFGPSMGGLISRYALAYMESINDPHNTRLYISFDAPQRGANIPLGDQAFLDFFAKFSSVSKENIDKLRRPAAKQMLVYHIDNTVSTGSGHHPSSMSDFSSFYSELLSLGYPKRLRKIAFSNGSGFGGGQGFSPSDQIIQYETGNANSLDITCALMAEATYIRGDVWAVNNGQKIFDGKINCTGYSAAKQIIQLDTTVKPYDSAPGGRYDATKQIADGDPGKGDIQTNYPYAAFIPTISALDISTDDLYYNVAANSNIRSMTPFDQIYFPSTNTNEDHIFISAETADRLLKEITAPQLSWLPAVLNLILDSDEVIQVTTSLIQNPGFEEGRTPWPSPWVRDQAAGSTATFNWEGVTKHSGALSVSIANPTGGASISHPSVAYDAAKTYAATAWIKTQGVSTPAARIEFNLYDAAWNWLGYRTSVPLGGTADWKQVALSAAPGSVPAGTAHIDVALVMDTATGIAWFDDVNFGLAF